MEPVKYVVVITRLSEYWGGHNGFTVLAMHYECYIFLRNHKHVPIHYQMINYGRKFGCERIKLWYCYQTYCNWWKHVALKKLMIMIDFLCREHQLIYTTCRSRLIRPKWRGHCKNSNIVDFLEFYPTTPSSDRKFLGKVRQHAVRHCKFWYKHV